MNSKSIAMLACMATSAGIGCDRSGRDILPAETKQLSVIEIGEMAVLTTAELEEFQAQADPAAWCAEPASDDSDAVRCFYGQLGHPELGIKGGATFTFQGTGETVCLLVDPETVYWSESISIQSRNENYAYPDYLADDGDIDLFGGLSSYYTGSPGVELGDFKGYYTDSLGRELEIEYGECTQIGHSMSGITNAHAGRGTVEYCSIETEERAGVEYTAVLETFAVPLNDGVLSFATMVVEGTCGNINKPNGIDECTIMGESLDPKSGLKGKAVEYLECTEILEVASCDSMLQEFCCANPEMCSDSPPEDVCVDFDREAFCSDGETMQYCCD